MIRKGWLGVVGLAIGGWASQAAPAQFGGFFGGPKIETISTADLQSLLKKQQQAVAGAKASDAELPLVTLNGKPTNRVHTYSDRYKIPSKYEQVTQ